MLMFLDVPLAQHAFALFAVVLHRCRRGIHLPSHTMGMFPVKVHLRRRGPRKPGTETFPPERLLLPSSVQPFGLCQDLLSPALLEESLLVLVVLVPSQLVMGQSDTHTEIPQFHREKLR